MPTSEFHQGVLYAAARLVEMFDQPSMAAAILRESGSNVAHAEPHDRAILRKGLHLERGFIDTKDSQ